jgi:hypothetical protein
MPPTIALVAVMSVGMAVATTEEEVGAKTKLVISLREE